MDNKEKQMDEIVEQFRDQTSNGNREDSDQAFEQESHKGGSAQRGGPDLDKARLRQPPDAQKTSQRTAETHDDEV